MSKLEIPSDIIERVKLLYVNLRVKLQEDVSKVLTDILVKIGVK